MFVNLKYLTLYYCPLRGIETVIRLLDQLTVLNKIKIFEDLKITAIQYYSCPLTLISDKKIIKDRSEAFIDSILKINPKIKIIADDSEFTDQMISKFI